MSLWGILPSPLVFGGNPTRLSGDAWSSALLTNDEVLAVNQDAAGTHAKRIAQQGSTEVWARDLLGGRKAVALFNRGTDDATVSVTFSQLGISETPEVRDLWNRQDVAGTTTGISANVPHEGALMYTLSPPGGTGGDGGVAGGSSAGGNGGGGAGGTTAVGGASGASGSTGVAGALSAAGSAGAAGLGAAAGSTAAGGGGASGAAASGTNSGCSCSMQASASAAALPWFGCALLLLSARRKRQRRPT
jgi:hypothetical protein